MLLSKQELKVMNLIHLTNREIAFELDLCDSTVKFHKTNIFKKLGVKCAWELICKQNLQPKATTQKRKTARWNKAKKQDQSVQNKS